MSIEERPPLEPRLTVPSVHADLLDEEVPAEREPAAMPAPPVVSAAEIEQRQEAAVAAFV